MSIQHSLRRWGRRPADQLQLFRGSPIATWPQVEVLPPALGQWPLLHGGVHMSGAADPTDKVVEICLHAQCV